MSKNLITKNIQKPSYFHQICKGYSFNLLQHIKKKTHTKTSLGLRVLLNAK